MTDYILDPGRTYGWAVVVTDEPGSDNGTLKGIYDRLGADIAAARLRDAEPELADLVTVGPILLA